MKIKLFLTALTAVAWNTASAAEADSLWHVSIDPVVVTGSRSEVPVRLLPMSITTITPTEIAAAHEPSLMPLLNACVPSLFVTGRGILGYGVSTGGSGGIKVRGVGGSPTTGVLVLIDGHPQYQGLMGHSIADAYQSMMAERVEVVRGPASVLYGSNAMCGVVNIITRQAVEQGARTHLHASYGSYNTLTSGFSNMIRREAFSSVLAFTYDRTDGHRDDMGFGQGSGFLKLAYDLMQQWRVFTDANITHFNASNPGTVDSPLLDNDSRITRGVASAAIENHYENTSGALKFFFNWGCHRINDGYAPGAKPLDYRFSSRDHMLGVSLYQTARLWQGARLTAGADWQRFGGEAWNRYNDGSRRFSADTTVCDIAGYASFSQTLWQRLVVDAGARLDHHSVCGNEWIPQMGITLLLPGETELKAIASKGFRNPTLRELFMWQSANPELRAERLWNYEVSVSQWLSGHRLHYHIGAYYIDADNLIETRRFDGRPMNVNTGRLRNKGFEVETSWTGGRIFSCSANYSYLSMRHPVLAAPRHKLNVETTFAGGRWSVRPAVQYIAGLYTRIAPDVRENYLLVNLNIDCRVTDMITFYVKGENLLAEKYEINAGYPMPKATAMAGVNLKFH